MKGFQLRMEHFLLLKYPFLRSSGQGGTDVIVTESECSRVGGFLAVPCCQACGLCSLQWNFPAGFELLSCPLSPPRAMIFNYEKPALTKIEWQRLKWEHSLSECHVSPSFQSLGEYLGTKSQLHSSRFSADKMAVICEGTS